MVHIPGQTELKDAQVALVSGKMPEKFENQDVALAMITARGEIEEMKEIRHGKKI